MVKDIFRVFTTNMIKFFVALIATFLIPAVLSVDEYGYYKVFGLYAAYTGILHFGFCDGLFLNYGGKKLETCQKDKIAAEQATIVIFELVVSAIILIFGIVARNVIIILLALNVLPSIMITFYTFLYQATGDFKKYAKVYNFQSLTTLVINSALVFIIKPASGLVYAAAVVIINYFAFLLALLKFNKEYNVGLGSFSFKLFKKYVLSGILLTIGTLSFLLFESIDRWFVKGLMGLTFFAYYSFAAQLLSALNMFANPIGMTLFSYLSRNKSKEFEYTIKTSIISLLLFMLNGVYVLRFIVRVFFEKYEAAQSVIIILFLAQVFLLLNSIVYINLYKTYLKQKQYFISLVFVIAISVGLNALFYYMIAKSMIMIAVATLVSMFLWTIINSINFRNIQLKPLHLLFVAIVMGTYLLTSFFANEIVGLCIYFTVFIAMFYFMMPQIYNLFVSKLSSATRKVKNILRKEV